LYTILRCKGSIEGGSEGCLNKTTVGSKQRNEYDSVYVGFSRDGFHFGRPPVGEPWPAVGVQLSADHRVPFAPLAPEGDVYVPVLLHFLLRHLKRKRARRKHLLPTYSCTMDSAYNPRLLSCKTKASFSYVRGVYSASAFWTIPCSLGLRTRCSHIHTVDTFLARTAPTPCEGMRGIL
jgi:hypothetical protein